MGTFDFCSNSIFSNKYQNVYSWRDFKIQKTLNLHVLNNAKKEKKSMPIL